MQVTQGATPTTDSNPSAVRRVAFASHSSSRGPVLGSDDSVDVLPTQGDLPFYRISSHALRIIRHCHNASSGAGHLGVARTIENIKAYLAKTNQQTWESLEKDVKEFRQRCPVCQLQSAGRPQIHTAPYLLSNKEMAMRHLAIDTLGPFPPDDQGNIYIIVIICCFSRFVQLFPSADATAEAAARAIQSHFSYFGAPHTIRSDNGSQFANNTLKLISATTGIRFDKTIAYSHEENGLVERAHREVLYHLRSILYERRARAQWAEACPLVMRLLNSLTHGVTGLSPATIIMPLVDTKAGILYPHATVDNPSFDPSQLSESLRLLRAHLESLVTASFDARTLRVDNNSLPDPTEYSDGSLVLLGSPIGERPSDKLHSHWRGPYSVVRHTGARYTVCHLAGRTEQDVHISRLKPYIHDPDSGVTPLEVACRDADEFIVETIRGHDGTTRDRTNLQFLVHWRDFPESEDSWEPYSALSHTSQLHEYLRNHRMTSLIPAAHR